MTLGITKCKVLFVSSNSYPPIAGDSLFSFGIIKALTIQNRVTVLTLSIIDQKSKDKVPHCEWISTHEKGGRYKHLIRYLRNRSFSLIGPVGIENDLLIQDWDYIVIDHLRSFGMISHDLKKIRFSKLIYLAHNVEYLNRKQKIAFSVSCKEKLLESLNIGIDMQEKRLIQKADKVFALTEHDAFVFRNRFLKKNVFVQSPDYPFEKTLSQNRGSGILLIGSLNWFPNRLGVEEFLSCISDQVLRNRTVFIVGHCPEDFKKRWKKENVEFCGFVKDLESIFKRCEYLVVVNLFGTGIKMKIIDGLNNGLKVLAVKESAIGYARETKNLNVFNSVSEINEFLM